MDKSVLSSKTNWGVVLALLPTLFGMFGINVEEALVQDTGNFFSALWTLAFSGLALYGRWKAKVPLSFKLPSVGNKVQAHWLATIFALFFTVMILSGCTSMMQFTADALKLDVVSETAKQKIYKGTLVAFVAWGGAPTPECLAGTAPAEECIGGVQKVIYRYGSLTPCQETTSILCRDDQTWAKVKAIELATTQTLAATQPAIEAGTNDVQLLLSVPEIVHDAQTAVSTAIQAVSKKEVAPQ